MDERTSYDRSTGGADRSTGGANLPGVTNRPGAAGRPAGAPGAGAGGAR